MMVYTGRIGLKDDFIKYQAEARRQSKEAIKEAERQREAKIEFINDSGTNTDVCWIYLLVSSFGSTFNYG